jgi:hypothetical protein
LKRGWRRGGDGIEAVERDGIENGDVAQKSPSRPKRRLVPRRVFFGRHEYIGSSPQSWKEPTAPEIKKGFVAGIALADASAYLLYEWLSKDWQLAPAK